MPKPLLLVDIDGVVSLFGDAGSDAPSVEEALSGSYHAIDGIPHFLSATAAAHLLRLRTSFELVWASGWEEKANEYLPLLLGLPEPLPFIPFSLRTPVGARTTHAHWKLEAIAAYVGERPLAWIDDAFNPACHEWAKARAAPTLLVSTLPAHGLTAREARTLQEWAQALAAPR
ncbi:MAG TPA: HAD domain-containing protein [Solirubrobacteraceae bacterium]|nr:HAD domain-containing protein [Solirubrobacteraceae bacterium]